MEELEKEDSQKIWITLIISYSLIILKYYVDLLWFVRTMQCVEGL